MCGCTDTVITTTDTNCQPCSETCVDQINSECVVYNGSGLTNLGIDTGEDINAIFNAIDTFVGSEEISETITIPAASVKALFSSGYSLLPSAGSGTFIQVKSISLRMSGTLTTPYTVAGGSLQISALGATNPSREVSDSVLIGVDNTLISEMKFTSDPSESMIVNTPLYLYHSSSDPSLGTGDLTVYITYKIVTI